MSDVACPDCGETIQNAADRGKVDCAACGGKFVRSEKKQKSSKKKSESRSIAKGVFWGLAAFFIGLPVLLLIFAGITGALAEAVDPVQTPAQLSAAQLEEDGVEHDLEVIDHAHQPDDYGAGYIIGQIRSRSGAGYRYVQVDVSTYDAAGNLVENSYTNESHLGPGATWNFSVILNHDFDTYKIVRVSGRR